MTAIIQPEWLQTYLTAHPLQAGPLVSTIHDLSLSVGWSDLRILTLPEEASDWVVLVGHKRKEDPLRPVLPLPLHTTSLRPSSLKAIFRALSTLEIASLPPPFPAIAPSVDELRAKIASAKEESDIAAETGSKSEPRPNSSETDVAFDAETLYMAIVTDDSTVVYYKLSKGIKKPADIPDE